MIKRYNTSLETRLRATERHLPCGIRVRRCYLPPGTNERVPSWRQPGKRRYTIYLPRRDGRLSWSWCWLCTGMVTCPLTVSHPSINHLIAIRPAVEPKTFWS